MIDMRITALFFDKPKVMRSVDKTNRKILSQTGAFIRQRARTSIRKRKGSSPPGKPPFSHKGNLRRLILFGYDRSSDSVVVGPVGFRGSNAPNVLEFGGRTTVTEIKTRKRRRTRRRVFIAKRPFMGPAMKQEQNRLPKRWRNSLVGG